jgi:hypothetical protein
MNSPSNVAGDRSTTPSGTFSETAGLAVAGVPVISQGAAI